MGGVPEIRVLVSHDVYVQTLGYVHLYVCVCVGEHAFMYDRCQYSHECACMIVCVCLREREHE